MCVAQHDISVVICAADGWLGETQNRFGNVHSKLFKSMEKFYVHCSDHHYNVDLQVQVIGNSEKRPQRSHRRDPTLPIIQRSPIGVTQPDWSPACFEFYEHWLNNKQRIRVFASQHNIQQIR